MSSQLSRAMGVHLKAPKKERRIEFWRTSSLSIREEGALERTTAPYSILLLTKALKRRVRD